ncbi:NAD(P)/FAD-dependent oxidoreductase [Massilia sp. GCM10020059]|uniref:FAD-dependent oxidoreductase n=1 Tax=Massilia agrisoli TaxID=2892444 RepID=A0ABS8IME5_9BURK|nr:FAD-dependent oxidoreductase [Massilia agrisoli]MCC6069712.1 FAD-dependent oxidoreductase [Massilia agrisoli]
MKIAVIGAGVSGLSSAYRLVQAGADVTLFEAGSYFGGHSNTVDVEVDGFRFGVDTGFLVFNQRTYPKLIALFEELGVDSVGSDMSFSVKLPLPGRMLEWAGSNLDTVFTQRRNLFNRRFLRMLRDIVRFNKEATSLATGNGPMPPESLGQFLSGRRYSDEFRNWYLLPMAACIWSCPAGQMLAFPAATFIRFCHNHGLLQVSDRPQWRTVRGGSRNYVDKLLAAIPTRRLVMPVRSVTRAPSGGARSVRVETAAGAEQFDQVVLACHSDQALALLGDARADEQAVLGAIAYQPNRAVLHTDASCLPASTRAWSAWNYQSTASATPQVCVHYLINKLQPLPCRTPVIVSLNPIDEPDPRLVLGEFDYAHPVFDAAAIAAQSRLPALQGVQNTWFAGAWTGYGFHEDGLASGLSVAAALSARLAGQGDAVA